jgi:hypothetical protein
VTANKREIAFSIRYGLHFGVPEFESLGLRSGIRLKLLFLYYRAVRDKGGRNLQSLIPAEVSCGAKYSIAANMQIVLSKIYSLILNYCRKPRQQFRINLNLYINISVILIVLVALLIAGQLNFYLCFYFTLVLSYPALPSLITYS